MTPEDETHIFSLVISPNRPQRTDETLRRVLQHFGETDGEALGLRLMRDAIAREDADDLELATVVCATWKYTKNHLADLRQLAQAQWHREHEQVAFQLGILKDSAAVDALFEMTQSRPEYLDEYDGGRVLAVNAIHALGHIATPEAITKLRILTESDRDYVRERAARQLERLAAIPVRDQ